MKEEHTMDTISKPLAENNPKRFTISVKSINTSL